MEKQLAMSYGSLEQQVEERTRQLRETSEHLEKSKQLQEIINSFLRGLLDDSSIFEVCEQFIAHIISFPEFKLLNKGAVFLVDEQDDRNLHMVAEHQLAGPLREMCRDVSFGHCLCGRAAASGEIVFADSIDERHDTLFEGMAPHGHYCVPIINSARKTIGVFTVYTNELATRSSEVDNFLTAMAAVLASAVEYKKVRQRLNDSREQYLAITENVHDAIMMIDHQGCIIFWNQAAERIFGYKADEALGGDLHELICPERFRDDARAGMERFVQSGVGPLFGKNLELTAIRSDGTEFPVESTMSAINIKGEWAAVGVLRDISERKKAEEEREKLERQFRHAQKMESIGTLAGGIAHDFNNILTSILGYGELAREAMPRESDAYQDITQVLKAGQLARELVRQILAFSRESEAEAVPIQLQSLIKEGLKLLRSSIPSFIEIRSSISNAEGNVRADPSQIHQLLMNLCTNAFQAMGTDGGVLEVRLEKVAADDAFRKRHVDPVASNYFRLTVGDNGIGMDSVTLSRIFEPYFSTRKKEDGTGLGLAVVHGIVTGLLDGVIEVDSELGKGSEFRIYLPEIETTDKVDKEPAELVDTLLPQGKERILLVDDEQQIIFLQERVLVSLGYVVTSRTSSVEALELFRHKPDDFDLVLTDQSMPNMIGTRLADEIHAIRPGIPIVICTGLSEMNIAAMKGESGIREILVKPLSKGALAHTLRQVLDRRQQETKQELV